MEAYSSILDPIQEILSPFIFDNPGAPEPNINPRIREWIIDSIYEAASKFEANPQSWAHLYMTGSLCTYQYSSSSDCDISVFVDPNTMPSWDRAKLIATMVSSVDGRAVAGTPYPLQVFVVSPQITPELLYQPTLRAGYDLDQNRWVSPPNKNLAQNVELDYNNLYVAALEASDKMEHLIKYQPTSALEYYKQIHKRRKKEEAEGKGDLSVGNVVYKMMDKKGLFNQLRDLAGEIK